MAGVSGGPQLYDDSSQNENSAEIIENNYKLNPDMSFSYR